MADSPRIHDLERRVHRDPASIAFAQLAEEYRRGGRLDDAVRVCRVGLERYPAYVSARVTLGRTLIALEQYTEAHAELEAAVRLAPDNLAAVHALAELHQHGKSGGVESLDLHGLPGFADGRSSFDPDRVLDTVDDVLPRRDEQALDPPARFTMWSPSVPAEPPSRSDIDDGFPLTEPLVLSEFNELGDPALPVLETWLAAIAADRVSRRASS